MTRHHNDIEQTDHFYPHERTMLFIDGSNFYQASRALGFTIDFNRLRTYFRQRCGPITRAYYYTALPPAQNNQATKNLADWLSHNGFTVVSKETREFTSQKGDRVLKGNLDVEIAVQAMELIPYMDHAVLFSGDGDFIELIHALQRKGVRVTVVSTKETPTPIASNDLRKTADGYIDIANIQKMIQSAPMWGIERKETYLATQDNVDKVTSHVKIIASAGRQALTNARLRKNARKEPVTA